jgi:hypothetical protein
MRDRDRHEDPNPPAWPARRRRWLVILALASLSLVTAACSGNLATPGVASLGSTTPTSAASTGPGSSSSQSSFASAQLLKFSQCMRNHGLTSFPDPTSQGNVEFQNVGNLNPNSPQFQKAQNACQSLMPGALITPAEKASANTKALAFAQCMRTHGVPNFPDPNGQGVIKITTATNVAANSPQYDKAQSACQSLSNGFDIDGQLNAPGAGRPRGNSGS